MKYSKIKEITNTNENLTQMLLNHFCKIYIPSKKKPIEINSLINIITAVSETTDLELQTVCVLFKVTD